MLKKIISIILIFIWIYFLLIFLKPWTTDFIESHFSSKFSIKVRAFKQVLDWKKTFSEFKKFIWEGNPNIEKYFDSIDSGINSVKDTVDNSRKKLLDVKKWFDENMQVIDDGIKKVEDIKNKAEKISNILKNNPEKENSLSWIISSQEEEKELIKKEKILEIEDKIDEKVKEDIIKKNTKNNNSEKIYYNPMWDINDF